jgi:sortase A
VTLAPPAAPEVELEPEVDDRVDALTAPAAAREHVMRQAVVLVLAVVLGLAALVVLFEGPVAKVWYNSRQRHLRADFQIPEKRPAIGDAAAILQSPKIGLNVIVVEGDSAGELRGAPGHRPESPLPGKLGNSVIVGHRAGWGGPFGDLDKLHNGDLLVSQARGGSDKVVFTVREKAVVQSGDARYLARSNDYRLTLVTATGGNVSSDSLVVVATSGDPGELLPSRHVRAALSKDSPFLNTTFILALAAIAAAAIAFVQLRRRHRLGATLVVVVPLTIAGLVGVLLQADLLLSPLR